MGVLVSLRSILNQRVKRKLFTRFILGFKEHQAVVLGRSTNPVVWEPTVREVL
jgi:hypothetical protein